MPARGENYAGSVSEPEGLAPKFSTDRSAYAEALRQWFAGMHPEVSDVEVGNVNIPVATGFSNETAFFDASWRDDDGAHTERFVARIEPGSGPLFPAQTPALTQSVGVQHRIMTAVGAQGIAVPPIVGYHGDRDLLGQPFFVMGFVDGVIPADTPRYSEAGFLVDEATPEERTLMITTGLEAMASIHAIDWRAAGLHWLDGTGTGEPTQAYQLDLYRRSIAADLAGREHRVLSDALDWLAENDPHDERVGLIWGDARIGNIIWRDYRPAAVVDWEACALCPTEADLGWWLMFDRMSFDDMDAPRMVGYPTRDQMIEIYEKASGREVRAPGYWELFAAMRFCAIFVPLADRMVEAGIAPREVNLAVNNAVSDAVARLLEQA